MGNQIRGWMMLLAALGAMACVEETPEVTDPRDECVFCDSKADAFGIARDSYLAYGILELANTASLTTLDDDVPLDARAARGIVDQRPFEYIEQIDTVSYVGRSAFTNLASYAEQHGFVPFCGDGGVQAILESCDDGNATNGDGCSSTCELESGGPTVQLSDQPELIRGSAINVPIVNGSSYYMRERTLDRNYPDDVTAILERADGIIANESADDRVSFHELAILSKAPFYDSLFTDEKAALRKAWEFFEISSDPVVDIDGTAGPRDNKIQHTSNIVRPGPLVLRPMEIDEFQYVVDTEPLERLQQLPGLNQDGDPDTVEVEDIDRGLADYAPVFTQDELDEIRAARPIFFEELTEIASDGDFSVTYDIAPQQTETLGEFASFDGYTFGWRTVHSLVYRSRDDFDEYSKADEFDIRVYGVWNRYVELRKGGGIANCRGYCNNPFANRNVEYRTLNDQLVSRRLTGVILMEEWDGDERVYNRVLNFKRNFQHDYSSQKFDEYAAARATLTDGTRLSVRKYHYQSGYDWFEFYPVASTFNRNLKKMLPEVQHLFYELNPGRYEEFEGVVIDVHGSRALIAYIDGCEIPMAASGSAFRASCNDKDVTVYFSRGEAQLSVRTLGQSTQSTPFGVPYNEEGVGLDTSYYVTR